MTTQLLKPGQPVFWWRPGAKGRNYVTNRVKVPATFIRYSSTGKRLFISAKGPGGLEITATVGPDWVEAVRPGGET